MKTKLLCRSCHDNYSDENFCLGYCCGYKMVNIPYDMWRKADQSDRDEINELIEKYGKTLGQK